MLNGQDILYVILFGPTPTMSSKRVRENHIIALSDRLHLSGSGSYLDVGKPIHPMTNPSI